MCRVSLSLLLAVKLLAIRLLAPVMQVKYFFLIHLPSRHIGPVFSLYLNGWLIASSFFLS